MSTYDEMLRQARMLERAKEADDEFAVEVISERLQELQAQHLEEERVRLDPARDMTAMGATLVGVGETFDKMLKGVQQWGNRLIGDDEALAKLQQESDANDAAMASLKEKFPVATTVGNIAPYLATAPLSGVSGALAASTLPLMEHGTVEEQATNAGIDAAIGLAPFGLGKAMVGAKNALTGGSSRLQDRAVELGYQLTPGEALDSQTLRQWEASLESNPILGRPLRAVKEGRQDINNRVALEAIGDTTRATDLGSGELDVALSTAGGASREVIESKTYEMDDIFLEQLINIESKSRGGFFKDSGETGELIDKILSEGDAISGERMMELRSALGKQIKRASQVETVSPEYEMSLGQISRAVDNLIERNLSDAEKAAWKDARAKYTAAKRIDKSRAVNAEGDISGTRLYNSLRTQDPKGMGLQRNTSDLYDMARISQVYKGLPDSQTATRSAVPTLIGDLLTNPGAAALYYLGGRAATGMYANPTGYRTRGAQSLFRGLTDGEDEKEERD